MVTLRDQNAIVEAPATWYNRILANEEARRPPTDTKELNVFPERLACPLCGRRLLTLSWLLLLLRDHSADCDTFGGWER